MIARALELGSDPPTIYQRWWASSSSGAWPQNELQLRVPDMFPDEQWTVIDKAFDGSLSVSNCTDLGSVRSGEWTQIPGQSHAKVKRARSWEASGFLWRQSRRLEPLLARRWRVRIYIPAGVEHPASVFRGASEALDREGIWFLGKANLGLLQRRDQVVIWVSAADAVSALETIEEAVRESDLLFGPPPLTLRVGRIGVGHDPANGRSLGLAICNAISCLATSSESTWSADEWDRACGAFAINPVAPWRHPGDTDPFGAWSALEARRD